MSVYGLAATATTSSSPASGSSVLRSKAVPPSSCRRTDGCIVARSDEAKALGVKMAQPAFQAKDIIERHSIAVISGNLQFYTDMSNRVMQVQRN